MGMTKPKGTTTRGTGGSVKTKGIMKKSVKGKASPLRTTRASLAKKKG
jgi:hypothetical protein